MTTRSLLACLVAAFLVCWDVVLFAATPPGRYFSLSNSLVPSVDRVAQAIDITPDGRIAVAAAGGLTTFDPVTGAEFQNLDTTPRPASVAIAHTSVGDRVVCLADDPRRIALIFDLSASGQLTERARSSLTDTSVDFVPNLVLSSRDRIGFTLVRSPNFSPGRELVAFSLDNGAILDRLSVGFTLENLGMQECQGRRYILFIGGLSDPLPLVVVDATDPRNLFERGSIVLPRNAEFSGVTHTDYVFPSDCRHVFLANQFMDFAAVDLVNMTVADSFGSEFRFGRLKLFENGTTRIVAAQSADSGAKSGINKLLLLDVSNPADIRLIRNKDILNRFFGFYPSQTDFTFTRSGRQIYVALQERLLVLDTASLNVVVDGQIPGAPLGLGHYIRPFGAPERVLGAWNGNSLGSFDVSDPGFDRCLRDDSSRILLQFSSETGDYQFIDCSGVTIVGTGTISTRGGVVTLQHYSGDRRVLARIDSTVQRGTASIQSLSRGITYSIIDRNTADNACSCE